LNNYDSKDETRLEGLVEREEATFVVFGREIGEYGTAHLQGYVEFASNRRFSAVKRLLGTRCHLELRRGNSEQAVEYCTKDGDFEMFGEGEAQCDRGCTGKGARTDLVTIRDAIESGASEQSIARDHFGLWCRLGRSFEQYRRLVDDRPRLRKDLEVVLFYGSTGTGKTRLARELCFDLTGDCWITSNPTLQWFNGYAGQSSIVIDDFRGGAEFTWLLRVLDIYELEVPIKGSHVPFFARNIFITSNLNVSSWYPSMDPGPIERRIKKRVCFDSFVGREFVEVHNEVLERLGALGGAVAAVTN
jgi:hypothetical protein